ncbi:MAG: hypothetical protein KAS32_23685 [Candidatus Peribacteraceae bacterium]|nr:hypothetical protein [Candidatus Peribacteraceae bacterium]
MDTIKIEDFLSSSNTALDEKEVVVIDRNVLSMKIEEVANTEAESYAEATLMVCDIYGIDVDDISKYMSKVLIEKLRSEAIRDGQMASSSKTLDAFF